MLSTYELSISVQFFIIDIHAYNYPLIYLKIYINT
jgi:hypothetical protein